MDPEWAKSQISFTNRRDEKACIQDLFTARPNAQRYNTVKNLREFFKDEPSLHEEFETYPFNRKSDAWEIIDGNFVWYEVDGSHMTTCDKMWELSTIADIVAGKFHLFLYDVRFDASYFYNTNDLSFMWAELELGVAAGVIRWDSALPKTIRSTAKSFGMNFGIMRF